MFYHLGMFDFLRKKKIVKSSDTPTCESKEFTHDGLYTPIINGASRKRVNDQMFSADPTSRCVL